MNKDQILKNKKELEDALENATNDIELQKLIKLEIEELNKYAIENGFEISLSDSDLNNEFSMTIDDVFSITGRGTVVTGIVEKGFINTGDKVEIITEEGIKLITTIKGIEIFNNIVNRADTGNYVGLFLSNINKEDIEKGMIIIKSQTNQSEEIGNIMLNKTLKTNEPSVQFSNIETDVEFNHTASRENSLINNNANQNLNITFDKKNQLLSEINILIKDTDKVYEDINIQESELKDLEKQLNNKRHELLDLVNLEYSKNAINKTIESTILDIKSLFNQEYKSDLINLNFYNEIKSKIFSNTIEFTLQGLRFKHNSSKIKFAANIKIILFLVIASLLFYEGINTFFNIIAVIFCIIALGILIERPHLNGKKLIDLINKKKSDDLSKKINYLNSIHKLPKEVIQLINKD